jgi:hypothetical protein
MPSPFPGMDPYLEHPQFFPDFHDTMITEIRSALQERLPSQYYAQTSSRVWIEFTERVIEPDVGVFHERPVSNGPGVAVATAEAVEVGLQPLAVLVPYEEVRENFVEIRSIQAGHRLVTSIEVLSSSNKTPGTHGQKLYRQMQRELLAGPTNLVEIDLVRGGTHSTVVLRERAVAAAGSFDYHVCVRRSADHAKLLVYPIRLEKPLPTIAIPLLPGDAAVPLDLQAIFTRCYDTGPYRRLRPYTGRPAEPLTAVQSEWVDRLLREQGLIPPASGG